MPQIIDVPGIGPTSFPDGMTDAQIVSAIQANAPKPTQAAPEPSLLSQIGEGAQNVAAGLFRGAGQIGATILHPLDSEARKANLDTQDQFWKERGRDPESMSYGAGKIGAEIAGTAGIGGALAPVAEAANMAKLAAALRAGGFAKDAGMLKNIAGGAISGGASAAAVNPTLESTGAGAAIGGVIPPVAAGVAKVAQPLLARMGNQAAIQSIAERAARSAAGNDADRQFAIRAMDNAQTFVPGATPTAGEAIAGAQAPGSMQGGGILALQRGLHGHEGAVDVLPGAVAKQDEALSASLRPFAGGATAQDQAAALRAARDYRSTNSGAQYDALKNDMISSTPELESILGTDIVKALLPTAQKIHEANVVTGQLNGQQVAPFMAQQASSGRIKYSISGLQALKEAMDNVANNPAVAAATGIKGSSLVAKGGLRDALTDVMEKASAPWQAARDAYKAESIPINQLQFNQAIAGKLKNASGDTTGRTFLNAMDSGVAALEKKAGIPRAAGGPGNYLDPANEQALAGIQSHLERQQDMARMLKNIQGSAEASNVGSSVAIPHAKTEGILSDLFMKSVVGGGENAKRFMAEQLADPKKFGALLRGLPDNQKLEALRRIMQQGAAVSAANVGE